MGFYSRYTPFHLYLIGEQMWAVCPVAVKESLAVHADNVHCIYSMTCSVEATFAAWCDCSDRHEEVEGCRDLPSLTQDAQSQGMSSKLIQTLQGRPA